LYAFGGNKEKRLTARMYGVESFKINQWSAVPYEKLTVAQVVKNVRNFM